MATEPQETTIWKFPLQPLAEQDVMMPDGARILTVQAQRNQMCLWAQCDPSREQVARTIQIVGTGHTVFHPGVKHYLGSVQLDGGDFVFHVYEKAH